MRLFSVFILLMIMAGPAFAKPPPMTEELQGIWSKPDCATSEQVLIISRNFVLAEAQGVPFLVKISSWRSEPFDENNLYLFTGTLGDQAVIRKTNDGLIKMVYKAAMPTQALHTLWGSLEERRAAEYSRCVKLFDSRTDLGQDEVNYIFVLDKMLEGCADIEPEQFPSATTCHEVLFSATDTNDNKMLDKPELERLYRMTAFIKRSLSSCSALSGDYPGIIPEEAEIFSADALKVLDANSDGGLTFTEIAARARDKTVYQASLYNFIEAARNARSVLPFMPIPDVLKTCDFDRREAEKFIGTMPLTEKPGHCPACTISDHK